MYGSERAHRAQRPYSVWAAGCAHHGCTLGTHHQPSIWLPRMCAPLTCIVHKESKVKQSAKGVKCKVHENNSLSFLLTRCGALRLFGLQPQPLIAKSGLSGFWCIRDRRLQTAHQKKKTGSTQGEGKSSGRRGQLRATRGTQYPGGTHGGSTHGVSTGTQRYQRVPWSAMADHGGGLCPVSFGIVHT